MWSKTYPKSSQDQMDILRLFLSHPHLKPILYNILLIPYRRFQRRMTGRIFKCTYSCLQTGCCQPIYNVHLQSKRLNGHHRTNKHCDTWRLHIIDNTTGEEDQALVIHTHVPEKLKHLPVEVRTARNQLVT